MARSLCDRCSLREICSIKVLEKEVGLPISDLNGPKKERVLKCKHFDKYRNENELKDSIYIGIESFFMRNFRYVRSDVYMEKLKEIIYRK